MVLESSGPWTDLGLTLPIFLGYHLGVVFLPVRNAADVVTRELVTLADNSMLAYGGLTLGIGAVYVALLVVLGRNHALRWERFGLVAAEGVLYAIAMRFIAGYVVGRMFLAPPAEMTPFTGLGDVARRRASTKKSCFASVCSGSGRGCSRCCFRF